MIGNVMLRYCFPIETIQLVRVVDHHHDLTLNFDDTRSYDNVMKINFVHYSVTQSCVIIRGSWLLLTMSSHVVGTYSHLNVHTMLNERVNRLVVIHHCQQTVLAVNST